MLCLFRRTLYPPNSGSDDRPLFADSREVVSEECSWSRCVEVQVGEQRPAGSSKRRDCCEGLELEAPLQAQLASGATEARILGGLSRLNAGTGGAREQFK